MPGFAQHSLDHRRGVVAAPIGVAEGPNAPAAQRLESAGVLDDLVVCGLLVGKRPAEEVATGVIRDLTAVLRQSRQVLRIEEQPALGSQRGLVELEARRQLTAEPQAAAVGHRRDQIKKLQERARRAARAD